MRVPRVILAGNAAAACRVLGMLLEVFPPENLLAIAPPSGRHHDWQQSLSEHAIACGIDVLEPDDINDEQSLQALEQWHPDLLLSVGYTQIFRRALLQRVGCVVLNVHPSLLPRHRGVAPLIWAIAEGDQMTGVTVHRIDEHVDTGPILLQYKIPIHSDETGFELHQKVAWLTRAACAAVIRDWLSVGEIAPGVAQSGEGTLHRNRDGTLNHLDLTLSARRVRDVVRALSPPLPGAFIEIGGSRVVLSRVEPFESTSACVPGEIEVSSSEVILHCADGPLRVEGWYDGAQVRDGASLPIFLSQGVLV